MVSCMPGTKNRRTFEQAKDTYISQWGALGSAWGINRTMSQIHALLMVATEPLNTDDVMAELQISRGNAHSNLKELVAWALVRPVFIKGVRKEHFEAEKDVWKVIQTVVRERKRRELQPAIQTLEDCLQQTKGLGDKQAKAFRKQLSELHKYADLADRVMTQVEKRKPGIVMEWILRMLK